MSSWESGPGPDRSRPRREAAWRDILAGSLAWLSALPLVAGLLAAQHRNMNLDDNAALIVIDVQKGFADPAWGKRNNHEAEANIARLVDAWTGSGRPIVRVRHASSGADSPLRRDAPGYAFQSVVADLAPALDVTKSVHSAFLGTPDLRGWLETSGVRQVVITGIQTNRCCETTARTAGDLGYDVLFVLDATHTFDEVGPDRALVTGDQFASVTAANIEGNFGRVVTTGDLLDAAT